MVVAPWVAAAAVGALSCAAGAAVGALACVAGAAVGALVCAAGVAVGAPQADRTIDSSNAIMSRGVDLRELMGTSFDKMNSDNINCTFVFSAAHYIMLLG